MVKVVDNIPANLTEDTAVALQLFNTSQPEEFRVTGILDPDAIDPSAVSRQLQLILCGGDRCEQHTFVIEGHGADRFARLLESPLFPEDPEPELDPPPGPRATWLDKVLEKHKFTVILFYRGFW